MKKQHLFTVIIVGLVAVVIAVLFFVLPSVNATCAGETLLTDHRVIQLRRPIPVVIPATIDVYNNPKGEISNTIQGNKIVVVTHTTNLFFADIHGESWIFIEFMHDDWSIKFTKVGMTLVGNLNICNATIGWVRESDLFPEDSQ